MSELVSEEQVGHFRRRGWVYVPGCLDADQLDMVRETLQRGFADPPPWAGAQDTESQEALNLVRDLRLCDDAVVPVGRDARVGEMVRALLGVEHVRLFVEAYLNKRPGGGPTPWHVDWTSFPFDRRDSLNVYVSLDDMTPEQGAVEVVSGSHRLGPISTPKSFGEGRVRLADALTDEDLDLLWSLASDDDVDIEGVPTRRAPIAAGDALVWASLTLHGAPPNATDKPRRAYSRTYIGADVRYSGAPYPVAGFVDPVPDRDRLTVGEPFALDRYPVVA